MSTDKHIELFTSQEQSAGSLRIVNRKEDAAGRRVAEDFLKQTISNVCTACYEYFLEGLNNQAAVGAWQHPLLMKERLQYSSFAQAIAQVTKLHLSEVPISRKTIGEDPENGRVDFWAFYRKFHILLELKRKIFGFDRIGVNSDLLLDKLSSLHAQVKNLKKSATEWASESEGVSGAIVIGLETLLPYRTKTMTKGKEKKELGQLYNDAERVSLEKKFLEALRDEKLAGRVDYCAIWHLPQEMVVLEYDNQVEAYPYIAFLGKIELI